MPGARPSDRVAAAAMPHASAINPVEMDASSDNLAAADEPPAANVSVRSAPGLAARPEIQWIETNLRRAVEAIELRHGAAIQRIDVLIVDDVEMTRLHQRHSGEPATTDVLTFDGRDDRAQPVEADIVICADEAARRCAELKHPLERELLLYCVHGVLHCLGFDDHDQAGWQRMHAMEDEILAAIGVGAVFHERPAAPKEDQR